MIGNNGSTWSPDEISEVAKWQRYLIWLILFQIASMLLMLMAAAGGQGNSTSEAVAGGFALLIMIGRIVVGVLSIYGVYKMAKALRKGVAVIYAVAMLLPLIGLIVLLVLNSEATRIMQTNNIRVGLMGANAEDVERVKSQINTLP